MCECLSVEKRNQAPVILHASSTIHLHWLVQCSNYNDSEVTLPAHVLAFFESINDWRPPAVASFNSAAAPDSGSPEIPMTTASACMLMMDSEVIAVVMGARPCCTVVFYEKGKMVVIVTIKFQQIILLILSFVC